MKVDNSWTAFEKERRRRGRKYRTAEVRMLKGAKDRQQFPARQDDALGLEGTTKTGDGGGKVRFENLRRLRFAEARLNGTFEEVSQHEATLLKLAENCVRGLSLGRKLHGFEKFASFAFETAFGRIEEIAIIDGRAVAEKKSLDVDRAIARGALKPVQAAGDVRGRGKLPATVTAAEACACGGHAKA
jgi:hypothetical protein